ncbi:pyridoxine 5'-phosphate synthase [Desulfatibacillum aliphaticivorans]|uniref:Pyridoxine 5'-phosphate synthase n=1 Tax=Desulfatibacillum aliphaticivorans TaxID=218208 RepID=PDXJ_DESAL|nr:pyridoxine 5'-phosphate synthase [Desulfatibacillum aliphaticivorans]B8FJ89.1 RecName: Full=Pyridoxine 5'-phosphate synthase; Short=PNP synthase [Desulfatibacillum aliphaticivorans]ACL05016.1 pyridoxal phosphate biosynthetic protein PdxJ [Desulfatibacillum aliphaticivorans]
MAGLAVNVDHVATLRQARGVDYPDPVAAAVLVELAGADGVVVHLREDRRHIQDRDVRIIRQIVQSKLILEMAATPEMIGIALEVRPHQATLVPEKREEVTTEGGLDVVMHKDSVADAIKTLQAGGIKVSLFVDPDLNQIKAAHKAGADVVELHTGDFCESRSPKAMAAIQEAARLARKVGMEVHAGHGIDFRSIQDFVGVKEIQEFSIGHSIVSRAVFIGLDAAVKEMMALARQV